MRKVCCYMPGGRFPSISVTGARCGLGCPHCAGHPLAAMLPAETPARLTEIAGRLADDGAVGFLLSGGCSSDGILHFDGYLDAIKTIKGSTDLRINAHVGFPRRGDAAKLADSGIDSFSITFPMSDRIGKQFLLVDDAIARYRESSTALSGAGAKVIPHALLGLGDPQEDIRGIEILGEDPPRSLVAIAFIPLKGTPLESKPPTSEHRIIESLKVARAIMPDTKLVLGCMRPRGNLEMERFLIENILDGIAMPAIREVRSEKASMEIVEGCCAVHL
jgi:lipoyl synthase